MADVDFSVLRELAEALVVQTLKRIDARELEMYAERRLGIEVAKLRSADVPIKEIRAELEKIILFPTTQEVIQYGREGKDLLAEEPARRAFLLGKGWKPRKYQKPRPRPKR